jgi:hypothetical protein
MSEVRISLPAALLLAALTGAAAFALGRTMPSGSSESPPSSPAPHERGERSAEEPLGNQDLPPGHVPVGAGATGELPPGHPPVDPTDMKGAGDPATGGDQAVAERSLSWKAPARWQTAANTSKMRIATYRIPRAAGDADDAEMSVMQAGGTVQANADRWVGQFDAEGQKTAKRSTRNVGSLAVTIVEVQGSYSGMAMGMGGAGKPSGGAGYALLGAIVPMPDMPYFFKLTGPAKTVAAARGDFDALVGTFAPR